MCFSLAKSGNPTWGPGYVTKGEPIRYSPFVFFKNICLYLLNVAVPGLSYHIWDLVPPLGIKAGPPELGE